jgi:hypothetical protein
MAIVIVVFSIEILWLFYLSWRHTEVILFTKQSLAVMNSVQNSDMPDSEKLKYMKLITDALENQLMN